MTAEKGSGGGDEEEKFAKGIAEQALIQAAIIAQNNGMPADLAADFIDIAQEGGLERARSAIESIVRNADKLKGDVG